MNNENEESKIYERLEHEEQVQNWLSGYRTVVTCVNCNTTAYSVSEGEFASCSCGDIYVDQTLYYCRIGGDFGIRSFEQISELNYYLVYSIMQDFIDLGAFSL